MKKLLLLAAFSAVSHGYTINTVKLNELFSVENNPGSGSLTYTQAEKQEKIELGSETGHYALGMIFKGNSLPAPYSKDLKNTELVQIALGTAKGKVQFQVPQFGAATLIAKGGLKGKTTFKFVVPTGGPKKDQHMALLLFTSPSTPNEQSDEEKLKGTFFSQTGSVTLTPKGKASVVGVRYQGKNVNFKTQTMSLEFKASLVTPFNSQENGLTGTIDFPVYSPHGREATELAKKIAAESMGGMAPPEDPEGLSTHNRSVAGSTKEDAPRNLKKK